MSVHWYGMVAVALGLFVALRRRPSRASWTVAVALSAYCLINFLLGIRAWDVAFAEGGPYSRPAVALSYTIAGILVLAQLLVSFRCWQARALWRGAPDRAGAPVA